MYNSILNFNNEWLKNVINITIIVIIIIVIYKTCTHKYVLSIIIITIYYTKQNIKIFWVLSQQLFSSYITYWFDNYNNNNNHKL